MTFIFTHSLVNFSNRLLRNVATQGRLLIDLQNLGLLGDLEAGY
jgi:hypothetical protein